MIYSVAFSPDGKLLAVSSYDALILWNLTPQSWAIETCQRVGRNFTRDEWSIYFPNEEYRKTCEQWDLESEPTPTLTMTP
jgi:WD40 repeat protein